MQLAVNACPYVGHARFIGNAAATSILFMEAGVRLRISGAELSAGSPSEALEACKRAVLKVHFNGTHRCDTHFLMPLPCISFHALQYA